MKNNKGITLISLVITIIVLLILAGISVQMISGDNGIIGKAIDAKNQMEDGQDFEIINLKVIESSTKEGRPDIEALVPKLQDMGCTVSGESFPLTVSYKEKDYKIQNDGTLQVENKNEEYKEVEYIESTGTQYIDTGYIPKANTKLELTLSFSGEYSPDNLNMYIFFSTASKQDDFFGVNFGGGEGGQNSLFAWFDKSYYEGGNIEALTISDDIRTNKNTIIVENGHISYGTAERTITNKSADQITSMILFGFSNYEDDPIPISALNMKVYRLKLYENNTLVREYVPCYRVSDNEIGLYELVNNVFYPNNGTGTFNKGNDIGLIEQ